MRALLIDPFQRKVHVIEVGEHISDWYKWIDSDIMDVAYLGEHCGQRQDVWVDDEGLQREPSYPYWIWKERGQPLCGYGLVLATTKSGESVATKMEPRYAEAEITWELWETRLKAEDYFDNLSRIYLLGTGKTEKAK